MLISLHVKNLALIDEEEVIFEDGLNILTGETGAGKSVIIGSVNLALGAKADKELIRTGAEYALIELTFLIDERRRELIHALDLNTEEDGTLLIQRKIMLNRSVCKVCGESVSTKQLQELSEVLIDIHGQHEHQSLLKKSRHKDILDEFSGDQSRRIKEKLKGQYDIWMTLKHKLEAYDTDEETRKKEISLLSFELEEINNASFFLGEDEELEQKYRKMVNSRKIREAAALAYRLTGYESGEGAGENIGRALKEIRLAAAYDDMLFSLEEQLKDIDSLLNDFNRGISDYMTDLDFDEENFIMTENRLNILNHLKAKYGKNLEEIIAYQQKSAERLSVLEDYENFQKNLSEELMTEETKLCDTCGELSKLRKKQAERLSEDLTQALLELNFEDVNFKIFVKAGAVSLSANGYDDVEFLISTNRGEELKPLSHIASGGELSRIMLALKTVLAEKDEIQTLIFDEIDTGISGKTAWKVSEKLGLIGRNHQVICITHLPQIAAMADSHYLIEKNISGERNVTKIHHLEKEESLKELARMLGSDEITGAALQNAKELKDLATNTKQY